MTTRKQNLLFEDKIDLLKVDSVIGSGYEQDVAKLAIEDGVAYRASRKNLMFWQAYTTKKHTLVIAAHVLICVE